jgi:glucose/mannose-6-phosphate isomerase
MADLVATMGDQLRWARGIELGVIPRTRHVLVCGMGGSGISGDFVASLTTLPVTVHKGYGLPAWAPMTGPLVVVVSYSGDTEESLSAADQAAGLGLGVVAVTTGGSLGRMASDKGWPCVILPQVPQPRAALGYLAGSVLRLLAAAGAADDPGVGLDEAGRIADELLARESAARNLAADLAEGLDGRAVVIYGAQGLTAPVAQRWKTQINENAKWPAFWSVLPELDHNEILGWSTMAEMTSRRFGIVALRDSQEGAAMAARFKHTLDLTSAGVPWVGEVWSQGESQMARMISLVVVGDLVSLELAARAGVDPMPVAAIAELKRRLSEEPR